MTCQSEKIEILMFCKKVGKNICISLMGGFRGLLTDANPTLIHHGLTKMQS